LGFVQENLINYTQKGR